MDSKGFHAFPFLKLPTELRQLVYRHLLVFPKPIHPVRKKRVSFYLEHIRGCPLNQHRYTVFGASGHAEIYCENHFTSTLHVIYIPDTALSILGTCHEVLQEAIQIFYASNHFIFGGMTTTADFLCGIGDRYLYLSELSFKFETEKAQTVFSRLARCKSLKKLHVLIDIENYDVRTGGRSTYDPQRNQRSLHDVPALKHMLSLKGLKVLELGGSDRIAGPSGYTIVDINDPAAIGPYIREKVTAPYEDNKSKVKAKRRDISEQAKKVGKLGDRI